MTLHRPRRDLRAPAPPGTLRAIALIARRGAIESLRDRLTLLISVTFALVVPALLALAIIRPLAGGDTPSDVLGKTLATYLLIVGLMPATASVGIAAGQFAGEKEQGSLTPLLASPASNVAIFGGKLLGAITPPFFFSLIAEGTYTGTVAATIGADKLRLLPPALTLAMLALVPAVSLCAAAIASLISSRVRTFNTAQQISGLALVPLWGLLFGLTFRMGDWGPGALLVTVLGIFAADAALILVAAATWRREEVLAQH